MKTDFHIVPDQRAAFVGAENNVHKTTQMAVGHDLFFYSSLRDLVSFVERSEWKYLRGFFFKGKNRSVAPEGALAVRVALPSTGFGAKTNLRKTGNFAAPNPVLGYCHPSLRDSHMSRRFTFAMAGDRVSSAQFTSS
jgi:hypothetical protein